MNLFNDNSYEQMGFCILYELACSHRRKVFGKNCAPNKYLPGRCASSQKWIFIKPTFLRTNFLINKRIYLPTVFLLTMQTRHEYPYCFKIRWPQLPRAGTKLSGQNSPFWCAAELELRFRDAEKIENLIMQKVQKLVKYDSIKIVGNVVLHY